MIKLMKRVFIVLGLFLCTLSAKAQTPTYTQSAWNDVGSGPSTITVQFTTQNTTAHSSYVVHCGSSAQYVTCNSTAPTDTEGNSYSIVGSCTTSSPAANVQGCTWEADNVVGGTKPTITVGSSGGGVGSLYLLAYEVNCGASYVCARDQGPGYATNNTTTGASASVTTTHAVEILLAVGSTYNNVFTSSGVGSWTWITSGSQQLAYYNVTSTGSYQATDTLTNSGAGYDWIMGIVTLYANASGGSSPGGMGGKASIGGKGGLG